MLHLSSLVLGSLVFACSLFLPAGYSAAEEKLPANELRYFETVYATDENEPMPIDLTSVTIPYITKTQTSSYSLAMSCPKYTYAPALGSCAAVSGGNVLGFFDRYDENIIPDHKSGTPVLNTFIYSTQDDAVRAAIDKLYQYMGGGYGATENDFINGITKYCNEKGKNISFSSCMQNGSFNFSTAKSYIDSNQPIVLFLSGYNVGTMYSGSNSDTIDYYVSGTNHIMIGFGYQQYTYTTSEGTKNYDYISVSSGLSELVYGIYDVNFQTKINDALAVNIY